MSKREAETTKMTHNGSRRFQRVGVLDIGSNSVRFVIFELFGAAFTAVYNEKVLAGLGRELTTTSRLSESGKNEAFQAIRRFHTVAQAQNLDDVLVGATAALRMAKDAPEFIAKVKKDIGIDISPVSGGEEARLTALGLIAAQPRAKGIAADLGGASLELIEVGDGQAGRGVSYPVGPFQIVGGDLRKEDHYDSNALRERIEDVIDATPIKFKKGQNLYLIGGAWRNLAGVHQKRHLYPLKTLQAYELMPGAARDLAAWAKGPGRMDLINWPDISARRAETLPYSGLMLDVLMDRLKPAKVIISSSGLRQGLILDAMPDDLRSRDSLLDGCRDLARGNLQGLHFAGPLMTFLSDAEKAFPSVFGTENEARIRRAACHLVGIGKGLHPDYRAELVFTDVLYAPLAGLSHKERAYLALILYSSYTSKTNYPNSDAIQLLLTLREREAAMIYGSAMRLGVVASGRSSDLLPKFTLKAKGRNLTLEVDPEWSMLVTERVEQRLNKLGAALNRKVQIQSSV